jgi:hypothetical protein
MSLASREPAWISRRQSVHQVSPGSKRMRSLDFQRLPGSGQILCVFLMDGLKGPVN